MHNILASQLKPGHRVDASILPELKQHPMAKHYLFTVSHVEAWDKEYMHVEFEGEGVNLVVPVLLAINTPISIAPVND